MDTTLVIMAAGIGSRFGTGIKQLTKVGRSGEIIMDYSIHDAIAAGFKRIVFIIRKEIEAEFIEVIGDRIEKICAELGVKVGYTFQALDDLPEGYALPEGRTKPWGTGQAVLACRDILDGPFAVINADDYYGKEAYKLVDDFLKTNNDPAEVCMAGYILKNTLSESGGVTRGVCAVDENGYLTDINETSNIVKTPEGASVNGKALSPESIASMNFWGFSPAFIGLLKDGFVQFLDRLQPGDIKTEYLLPIFVDELLKAGKVRVKVLPTNDKWFGMTYQEDIPGVVAEFNKLIDAGEYRERLFDDMVQGVE